MDCLPLLLLSSLTAVRPSCLIVSVRSFGGAVSLGFGDPRFSREDWGVSLIVATYCSGLWTTAQPAASTYVHGVGPAVRTSLESRFCRPLAPA